MQAIKTKRKCRNCKAKAKYMAGLTPVCSSQCAIESSKKIQHKSKAKKERDQRKSDKVKLAELNNTVSCWTKKAQIEFNKYIRVRDYGKPCISCGKHESELKHSSRGGLWDCGHYRSVGSCPELRFEPKNAHKQCKSCNNFLSGNIVEYRLGLSDRLSVDDLDWIEGPHEPPRYRVEQLKSIYHKFKQMTKELEADV